MLLLGRRAARAAPPARAPGGCRRRRRPLRLPGRPVAPAGGHAAELPDHRLRHERRGARRDPPAQRASSGHHRARLCRAGPRPVAVGPRHARGLDDRRRPMRGSSRSRPHVAPRSTPRPGRSAGRSVCRRRCCPTDVEAFDRYLAAMLAPSGRSGSRRRPASWRASCSGRRWPRWRRGSDPSPAELYAWTLWPSVGLLPASVRRGLRPGLGRRASGWCRPGWSPAGGRGGRCCRLRSGRCPRRWPRTGGWRPRRPYEHPWDPPHDDVRRARGARPAAPSGYLTIWVGFDISDAVA